MIKIIYQIDEDKFSKESEWLNNQKVYPAIEGTLTVRDGNFIKAVRIGAIVSEQVATLIGLRHNLIYRDEYRQR